MIEVVVAVVCIVAFGTALSSVAVPPTKPKALKEETEDDKPAIGKPFSNDDRN